MGQRHILYVPFHALSNVSVTVTDSDMIVGKPALGLPADQRPMWSAQWLDRLAVAWASRIGNRKPARALVEIQASVLERFNRSYQPGVSPLSDLDLADAYADGMCAIVYLECGSTKLEYAFSA